MILQSNSQLIDEPLVNLSVKRSWTVGSGPMRPNFCSTIFIFFY